MGELSPDVGTNCCPDISCFNLTQIKCLPPQCCVQPTPVGPTKLLAEFLKWQIIHNALLWVFLYLHDAVVQFIFMVFFFHKGTFVLDCMSRYFRMAFDTNFTGADLRFEAVGTSQLAPLFNAITRSLFRVLKGGVSFPCLPGDAGVYPITERYAAECGYSVTLLTHLGLGELRASYFSCHASNEVCEREVEGMVVFTFTLMQVWGWLNSGWGISP